MLKSIGLCLKVSKVAVPKEPVDFFPFEKLNFSIFSHYAL